MPSQFSHKQMNVHLVKTTLSECSDQYGCYWPVTYIYNDYASPPLFIFNDPIMYNYFVIAGHFDDSPDRGGGPAGFTRIDSLNPIPLRQGVPFLADGQLRKYATSFMAKRTNVDG